MCDVRIVSSAEDFEGFFTAESYDCCKQGPRPTDFACTLGVPCAVKLKAVSENFTSELLISLVGSTPCGDATQAAAISGLQNPSRSVTGCGVSCPAGNEATYNFGTPLTGNPGVYRACWGPWPEAPWASGTLLLLGCRGILFFFVSKAHGV